MGGTLGKLKAIKLFAARLPAVCGAIALLFALLLPSNLQTANANGDTRALKMHHNHTGENINIVFKRDGRYDRDALQKINWFLRDWRKNESVEMDPRLLDLVWDVYRELGANSPVHIICGYRNEGTNNMLRARSSGVASHSQHTLGKAMDISIPGVSTAQLREMGMVKQRGGVGFYPTSGTPFVHLDVGNVRAWPRMTTQQLARLFPQGGTLHLPSDGPPLPGYDYALAHFGRDSKQGGNTLLAYADRSERQPARGVLSLFDDQPAPQEPTTVASAEPAQPVKNEVVAAIAPLPLARPNFEAQQIAQQVAAVDAPMPLLRPAILGRVTLASLMPKPKADLTPLHFEPRAIAGFFGNDRAERKTGLTAPKLQLAARDLNAPVVDTKTFGPRRWLRFASFAPEQTRLAMNNF
ncbi:MAG: DUF882 domain-containing protein [Pseudomonadota bacterium]